MSDNEINPILIEVEEAGIEAYMVDHQRMLDGLDNPSEVNGVGDGTCAGDNYVERESNAMGRDGGANGGEVKPSPVSKDSILICPEPRSDGEIFVGVKSSSPRDERGSVTEEVVENLVAAADSLPRYIMGPYLRISEYLNKSADNTVEILASTPTLRETSYPLSCTLVEARANSGRREGG